MADRCPRCLSERDEPGREYGGACESAFHTPRRWVLTHESKPDLGPLIAPGEVVTVREVRDG